MPSIDIDMQDVPDVEVDDDSDVPDLADVHDDDDPDDPRECDDDGDETGEPLADEDALEDGDRVFMATIPCEAEFIRATSNISQKLAEAFHKNTPKSSFHESVPTHLHDFEDLFSKASFDRLPDRKIWDHAIELVPGAKTSSCKVYPLAPSEQYEMDEFIQENLSSGRIRPSKSPMASPVFFIKKKDGTLRLVQDRGLFEPLVMFFGLTNSPSTFQTMMNDIF